MESVLQVGAINFSPLCEPRGFIRILEFVLSIFAFATTTSPDLSTTFNVINCNKNTSAAILSASRTFSYGYPFDLENTCFKVPVCPHTTPVISSTFCLLEGAQSSAQFYVCVGVLAFLYCIGALILYIFFDELYRQNSRIVVADFVISVVLTLFWIISSSAWASGLNDVKLYTDPEDGGIFGNANVPECQDTSACKVASQGNFTTLNISIVFGFLNFLVWLGNLWFLYKETPWFKVRAMPPSQPDNYAPSPEGGMYQ